MTWIGYLYTVVVSLLAMIAVGIIAIGLWYAPVDVRSHVDRIDESLLEEAWERAEDEVFQLQDVWPRARALLSISRGQDHLDTFDEALQNLKTEIEERRRSEARVNLSTLRKVLTP